MSIVDDVILLEDESALYTSDDRSAVATRYFINRKIRDAAIIAKWGEQVWYRLTADIRYCHGLIWTKGVNLKSSHVQSDLIYTRQHGDEMASVCDYWNKKGYIASIQYTDEVPLLHITCP
jgi:hypothetical protein